MSNRTTVRDAAMALALASLFVMAAPAISKGKNRVCSETARLQYKACKAERIDDYYETLAFCINDVEGRIECKAEAKEEASESKELCKDQLEARKDLCDEIGEDAYDPIIDPNDFQDPRNPSVENPYFPLSVGNRWIYEEDGEMIDITVQDETKRIAGIDCIVYQDIVTSEGLLVEDTDDWFAVKNNGDVIYCGEEVKDYEYTEGDDPFAPELIEIDGRFKIGVDLAKSGVAFLGTPVVGQSYRQEWDPGNAEDIGKVLSTTYQYGEDAELDELVPQALAELMCADGDCIVIQDSSTLDPDALERKYYARGVGKILEVKPDEGEFVSIVECNVDVKCAGLPIESDED